MIPGHPKPCSHAIRGAHVTSLALGIQVLTNARARMHGDRLADDQTVLDQLPPQFRQQI